MLDPQQLSDREILDHIDEASFQRGQAYASEGRIVSPRRQGDTLKALCRGSIPEPYRLQATLGPEGVVAAECSCPVGYGGHCKHVAALLLTWRDDPERFVEVADLATALEGKSKEELVRLLLTVAAVDPSIEQLLEITASGGDGRLATPDASFYRDQVAATLGYGEEGWASRSGYGLGGRLVGLVAQGDAMGQHGDWRGAAQVYRGVLEGVMESQSLIYDEDGSLAEVAEQAIEGLGRSLAHLDDPADREALLDALFETLYTDISEYGGIGIADAVPDILLDQTTPEEREGITGRLRDAYDGSDEWTREIYSRLLIEFETEALEGEDYLERARELGLTDRLVNRLLELGRMDEALQAASDEDPAELDLLVAVFDRCGQGDLIEPLVEQRLAEGAFERFPGTGMSLERWLKERYIARGNFAAALPLSVRAFDTRPSIESYREARDLALATDQWEMTRQDLLAELEERAPALKTQIHLEEGELEEAIAGLRAIEARPDYYGSQHAVRLQVAEAASTARPEAALEIYQNVADELIDERGRDNYATAAALLVRVRDLYDRLDRYEEWESHIEDLRSDHQRLRALQEELDRVGV